MDRVFDPCFEKGYRSGSALNLIVMGLLMVGHLGLVGCGAPQMPVSHRADAPDNPQQAARAEAMAVAEARHGPSSMTEDFWPQAREGHSKPSAVLWTKEHTLLIGYEDGMMVEIDAQTRDARVFKTEVTAPVLAFSPDGEFAVLDTEPATLVDRRSGRVLIHLNRVPDVLATSFSADGGLWYVVDPANKIHVWSRSRLMAPATGEDIRSVLQRELPDYSAGFKSVNAPVLSAGRAQLLFSDRGGTVYQWDTQAQEIQTLMALSGPVQSISNISGMVAVTSETGQLRVLSQETNQLLPWTFEAAGSWASLLDGPDVSVAVVDKRNIALKACNTGNVLWSRPIPKASVCGLFTNDSNDPIALCSGSVIALLDPNDGSLHSTFRNEGGRFQWQDSVGVDIDAN